LTRIERNLPGARGNKRDGETATKEIAAKEYKERKKSAEEPRIAESQMPSDFQEQHQEVEQSSKSVRQWQVLNGPLRFCPFCALLRLSLSSMY
jgi:hypothetical protein